ncbi:sugar ABC transporter permease [Kitasatospora sp. NBC_01287]|uniref:carbohydrate ABC transporter permease n=1 Tax=Kitasatospora sp. NBC_01287 TaxID=2903573 RepID=UPI002258B6D7|nr:sugar ABC transporter permease [Kitasatospora sp. NBC_01287]MCX4744482.1 sugar ABC transporter permease [Kitasatospora sp. NBC_01287]
MAAITASRARGRPRTAARSRRGLKLRQNLTAHAFLFGALVSFGLFTWYPMVREVVMSFQRTKRGRTSWVGLDNLRRIVHDPAFWHAWGNTLRFTLLALVLGFALPFLIAVLLNELRHARAYLRVLVYLPVMLPPVAGVLLFKYCYDPNYGLFDHLLRALHLPTSAWLNSPGSAMLSVVIAATWMNMGGATLIYLAALQGIPGELYEAAELDGAGLLRKVWHVTIPQTRLILSLLLLLQLVATMQVFVEPYLLTGGDGPQDSTLTVVNLVYQYAFNFGNYGSAAALGLVMLLVLAGFSALYVRLSRAED